MVPGKNISKEADLFTSPIRVSDQLVRFNRDLGVFDVTYAAAWELGRFLALQSKTVSTELYHWKQAHIQIQRILESTKELEHLPLETPVPEVELPPAIKSWLENVQHLRGIPLNYLLPDEHMLPPESIRFFYVDCLWLECLQMGALSIGQSTKKINELLPSLSKPSTLITGFLLRSDVVTGWPGLQVDGYSDNQHLSCLHVDRLAKDILICLFDGKPNAVDFHLKPEVMHFGMDGPDKDSAKFYVLQRNTDGSTSESKIDIPWQDEGLRVISINNLAREMKTDTSAQFTFQMIEEGARVRFNLI